MKEAPVAATIGVFDGVHLGHALLVRETLAWAGKFGGQAVAFTFDPHPASILAPDLTSPLSLTLPEERKARLLELGLDRVHVLRFDRAMARMDPEEFLENHLFRLESIRHLVIGYDFALGKGRAGTFERLRAAGNDRGFEVTLVPALLTMGSVVSSSRIRRLIGDACFSLARILLGRPYRITGQVVSGDARGRTIGFPTANLSIPGGMVLPPHGVFYGLVSGGGGALSEKDSHPVVMNFGIRPTFGCGDPVLEVHVIDFQGDLLGAVLSVEFKARIRGEMRFEGPEALAEQIRRDIQVARSLAAGEAGRVQG